MLGGKNKQTRQPLGYTIVEVMIVLAVSGMMFIIAASFINGKQERTAFTQSSNDMVSQLQNISEDIIDGHYSDYPIGCTATGTGNSASLSFPASASAQGTNQGCVFLGKIVHFYGSAGQATDYNVFSLATAQSASGSISGAPVYAIPGLTTSDVLTQGLYIKSMSVQTGGSLYNTTAYNIGFAQGLGSLDSGDDTGGYVSGAQTINLVYTNGLDGTSSGNEADITGSGSVQSAQSATICVTDQTRYAQILIGTSSSNNNNPLSITAKQLGKTPC